jgi:hypothetical protein
MILMVFGRVLFPALACFAACPVVPVLGSVAAEPYEAG